ncbi:MAG: hypothetical protein ACRD3J_31345, partial [Thermoanaerobaculia bacterium]
MANPTEVAPSPSGRHSPSIGFFERLPIVAGSAVAVLGAFVLFGWAANLPVVMTWRIGGLRMIPLTALCFVLTGGSLAMAVRSHRTPRSEAIQQTLAALVATIGLLTFY